jgi:hypothetical protein
MKKLVYIILEKNKKGDKTNNSIGDKLENREYKSVFKYFNKLEAL